MSKVKMQLGILMNVWLYVRGKMMKVERNGKNEKMTETKKNDDDDG